MKRQVLKMADWNEVYNFVRRKIDLLDRESPWSRAMLAKLRRGVGKTPGSVPEIWEITIEDSPDGWKSDDGLPGREERAVHTALTFYALHRQSRGKSMSVAGKDEKGPRSSYSFGGALAKLIRPDRGNEQAVKRRFDAAVTASGFEEWIYHARGLIQLLRAGEIPMDYPRFAQDLVFYQLPDYRDRVRLRWGEDFYRRQDDADDNTENGGE
jgi:CRISPR system Cascade subunit CasB